MREIDAVVLDVRLYLERVVVHGIRKIGLLRVLACADDEVYRMLARLLHSQAVGLDDAVGEGLLIGLSRLQVVDGIADCVCVAGRSFLERDLQRVGLGVLIEQNLRVEEEREVFYEVDHCK